MFEESMERRDDEPADPEPPTPPPPETCEEPASPAEREVADEDHEDEPAFDPLRPLAEWQRVLQRAEAGRAIALLDAYEEAMQELVAVFGPDADDRGGPFARSFLLEAAQVLHLSERGAGTLLDAAQALRRSYPKSWAVFAGGEATWREVELVWRQAQGLEAERLPQYDAEAAGLLGVVPVSRLKERLHRLRERLQVS